MAELVSIREHSRKSLISCAETLESLATQSLTADAADDLRKHAASARESAKLFEERPA